MAKLNDSIKTFITQQLAMYYTPQEIADMVKENFAVEIPRQQVFHYNADMNLTLAKKWKDIFTATRNKFLEDCSTIAISNKSFRLNELNSMYLAEKRKNERLQNPKLKMEILEQAAKESGDAFTNMRKVENSGQIEVHSKTLDDWKKDAEARKAEVAETMEMFNDFEN